MAYCIIGVLLIAAGVLNLRNSRRKKKLCSTSVTAVIAEVRRDSSPSGNVSYQPIYEFDAGGRTVRGDGGIPGALRKTKYKVGDTAEVLYNPENPEEFLIRGKSGTELASVIFFLLGLGMLVLAVVK